MHITHILGLCGRLHEFQASNSDSSFYSRRVWKCTALQFLTVSHFRCVGVRIKYVTRRSPWQAGRQRPATCN